MNKTHMTHDIKGSVAISRRGSVGSVFSMYVIISDCYEIFHILHE